ncbi:hypothetical protein J3F84DRAFT_185394 [Trichoderma pleuroticola]
MADALPSNALECEACRLLSITIQADGETPAMPTCSCSLKRESEEVEVEDDHDAQISKTQGTIYHHEAPSPRLSPFASIRPPEPSSIIRQYCRERLYVMPLHWTLQHLDLLGCRFHAQIDKGENAFHAENAEGFQVQSQGQPREDQVPRGTTKLPPDIIIRRAISKFSRDTLPSILSNVMRHILEECGMRCDTFPTLKFYFNGHHVSILYTYGTFLRTSSQFEGPRLAFLSLRDLGVQRDMSIRPRHIKSSSPWY